MTTLHRAGAAAIAAFTICLSAPAPAQQPARLPGTFITGQVFSANSDTPLRRVRIDVARGSWSAEPILTDNEGRFSSDLERAGPVSVTATKGGYLVAKTTVQQTDIDRPLVLRLPRGAVISGTVFDEKGQPAVSTGVQAKRLNPAVDGFPAQAATSTDDRGDYRLAGLAPGRYELTAGSNVILTGSNFVPTTPPQPLPPPIVVDVTAGDQIGGIQLTVPDSRNESALMRTLSAQVSSPSPRPVTGAPPPGGIRGRVLTAERRPVVGASVRLFTGSAIGYLRTTDANGSFSVTGLRPGRYLLEASINARGTWAYGQDAFGGTSTPIVIADRIEEGIDISLPRYVAIQGVVVDEHGEPVQGARVQALQVDFTSGRLVAIPAAAERRTDDQGAYRLWGLVAGTYLLSASVDGLFTDGRGAPVSYAPMYYPGTPVVAAASTIELRDDATINLVVAPVALTQITGRGRFSEGPLIGGSVRLVESRRPGTVSAMPRTAPIQADGSFIIRNVPPGDYVLHVRGDGPGRTGMFATEAVSVGSDAVDLLVRVSHGTSLEGRTVLEGAPDNLNTSTFSMGPVPLDDRARPEATFVFGWSASEFFGLGLFGRVSFALKGAPDEDWYLKSFTINGTEIADSGFDFGTQPDTITDAEVIVSHKGASISGRRADTRSVATGYFVLVFPPSYERLPPQSRRVKFARSANDGSFRVAGLPAGDYLVAAVPRLLGNEWQNPDVLQQLASRAERVSLSEGQNATLSLRLIER